ncbi:hypothetical protein FA95DRAFT_1605229 [Auriscalpium vulgare]|uniref:Uncharacterized protein n=1 Tax=Auriscalpium vulgare TaxID=40419 RepID=A0ACB8RX47_9AGAM|nr:hypothetical protein FA95DRAFT_1605229 [Auriscalpium vulgare]
MSTTSQPDPPTPLEAHLLAVLALYEHGPIPESIPVYIGPASSQATEILRAIDAIARRTPPSGTTAPTTAPEDLQHAAPPPPSQAEEQLALMKAQVRDVALVCNEISCGNLSQRTTAPAQFLEMVELKYVVNRMADNLESFVSVMMGVAEAAGDNGSLGGLWGFHTAMDGSWYALSNAVNRLSVALTNEVRAVARVAAAVAGGDLSQQIDHDARGEVVDMHASVNAMVELLRAVASDSVRLAGEYGWEGRVGGQMQVQAAQGVWAEMVKELNSVTAYYTVLMRELIRVTTELSEGKTTETITVNEASGDVLELVTAVNQLVNRLAASPPEVPENDEVLYLFTSTAVWVVHSGSQDSKCPFVEDLRRFFDSYPLKEAKLSI